VDSGLIIGIVLLVLGTLTLALISIAEAGVIAGVRERVGKEPAESPVEALRRFYHERQITLSTLALARNLASVGVTGVVVYLVITELTDSWAAVLVAIVVTALAFMLLRTFTRALVAKGPQRWQMVTGPFVALVRITLRVPAALVDVPIEAVMMGGKAPGADGAVEELMMLSEMEDASAALQDKEREMIRGVMELEFTAVREVMVPRPDIVSVEVSTGFDEAARMLVERGFSRLPVYEGDIDHILGIVHAKEVLRHLTNGNGKPALRDILRDAHVVPESKKVHETLSEMKERQISIAVVVDEYGGTAGLVTVEDMVEEIVGEIRDEYDVEEAEIEKLSDAEAIVDARVSIDDINEMFKAQIQKEDFDSVGGFIVNELGRMPSAGDTVQFNGINLKVLTVAGRRIKKVLVTRTAHESED
jgi:putative hemolysin